MKARSILFIVTCLVMLMNVTSLSACDPKKRNQNRIWISEDHLWTKKAILDIYDGGWGFPQSVEVNTYDAECYPWLSGNGRFLFFASINFAGPPRPGHQGGNWDIYISEWDDLHQRWGREKNIAPPINTVSAERRPSCTWNGDTLYFNRWDNGHEDIFVSIFDGAKWSVPVALPAPVNTDSTNDEHPAISADGKRLYFTSNRRGGFGGSDIWVAFRDGSAWTSVVNFGPPVNTFNEESRPFESYDGKRLYFTSHGGYSRAEGCYGAGDIYVCTRTESGWGPVKVVAAPVNCDLEACSPYETPDGKEFWIGSEAWEGARGDEDIWVSYKDMTYHPRITQGYGKWMKSGELENALYVYDLKEGPGGIIYAAAASADSGLKGKVYKTNNGGFSWVPCGDLPGSMTVYTLIVQGDTLYAGTYPNGDVFRYDPPTSVEENHPATAHQYQMAQNYPNPFNSTTVIRFQMAKAGRVTIRVYNVLGQKIKILEDGYYEAGWHEIQFDGLDENNPIIPNGAYLYSMEAAKYTSVKKFLFLK